MHRKFSLLYPAFLKAHLATMLNMLAETVNTVRANLNLDFINY